jgi:hypothetical protein
VIGDRSPAKIAQAIVDAYLERDEIAAEQKRWVRNNASIEKATENLERVYQHYVRHQPVARAA